MKSTTILAVVAAAMVVAVAFGGGVVAGTDRGSPETADDAMDGKKAPISLSGTGKVKAKPDRATVRVKVTAVAGQPETARSRVADNVSSLIEQVKATGVPKDRIRTKGYGINQIEPDGTPNWEEDHDYPTPAYRATHTIAVKVHDLDRVGDVLTRAVDAGGATVQGVTYDVSRQKRNELKREAIDSAMANAKAKAQTIATRGNLELAGVKSVSTQQLRVPQFRVRTTFSAASADAAGVESRVKSRVQANRKTVTARVSVTFVAVN